MAVEAVASVVIQKLTDMLNEEPAVFDKVIRQVEKIRIKLRDMRGFLIDAEENQAHDDSVKKWADEYLLLLYNVEDIVETFSLRIARQRKAAAVVTKIAAPLFFFNNLNACKKLRRNISKSRNDITELNRKKPGAVRDASIKYLLSDRSSFQDLDGETQEDEHEREVEEDKQEVEEEDKVSAGPSVGEHLKKSAAVTLSFSYQEEDSRNFGFQEDLNALVKQLTSDDDKSLDNNGSSGCCNNILSIVGEEGSGKTTLASAIYKSKRIKDRFKCRAWICVCEDHNYENRDILLALLKQVETSRDFQGLQNPEQELMARLKQVDNYLLVLDNVHKSNVWSWSELRKAFPDRGNGSKIIITTRAEGIDLPAGSPPPHNLKGLRDAESWKMFLKKTHIVPSQEPGAIELQQKIMKICRGLPLRIALLGGLLSTKKVSREEWSKVLDLIQEQVDLVQEREHHSASDILSFCYNDLPAHLKLCLLYLTLFPKEFDIPVRRLVRLWLAEGFVKQSSTTKMPEDVAEEYFHDLVNRNLIHISKFRSDGSPRKCCLPSALHSYLLPKTQDIGLFHVHCSPNCVCVKGSSSFGLRRIVEYLDIKDRNLSSLQNLRSYISFNLQKKDIPAKKVKDFVSRITGRRGFGLLRVLDLEGVYKPSLPDKLGDLFHLRYLGLRWTFLDNLPASVGDLLYLETLDLKRTCINSLPDSIWKLKHLRHLNLDGIRLDIPRAPQTKLITLWGLFVDDKSLLKNGFNMLHDLRELGITFNLSSEFRSVLAGWISKLSSLQSLRLRSKDERGCPSALPWKPLSGLNKLSNLNLLGRLDKLPPRHEFPPELKVLTLSVSHLDKDPMPVLGQLKNLTVLRLLANSYTGKKIVCPLGGFSKLAVLKLWMLKNLEEWELKEGAMKNLKELDIRCCDKLRTLPFDPQQLSNLEEITLTNMPQPFVNDVRQNKSDNTSLTVNDWKFTPLPWEEEDYVSNEASPDPLVD